MPPSGRRGESRKSLKDGIYRASRRGASTHMRVRVEGVAKELAASGCIQQEPGKRALLETRAAIESGWRNVADKLAQQGDQRLAADVVRFVGKIDRPLTDREWLVRGLMGAAGARVRQREARTL